MKFFYLFMFVCLFLENCSGENKHKKVSLKTVLQRLGRRGQLFSPVKKLTRSDKVLSSTYPVSSTTLPTSDYLPPRHLQDLVTLGSSVETSSNSWTTTSPVSSSTTTLSSTLATAWLSTSTSSTPSTRFSLPAMTSTSSPVTLTSASQSSTTTYSSTSSATSSTTSATTSTTSFSITSSLPVWSSSPVLPDPIYTTSPSPTMLGSSRPDLHFQDSPDDFFERYLRLENNSVILAKLKPMVKVHITPPSTTPRSSAPDAIIYLVPRSTTPSKPDISASNSSTSTRQTSTSPLASTTRPRTVAASNPLGPAALKVNPSLASGLLYFQNLLFILCAILNCLILSLSPEILSC